MNKSVGFFINSDQISYAEAFQNYSENLFDEIVGKYHSLQNKYIGIVGSMTLDMFWQVYTISVLIYSIAKLFYMHYM